MQKALITVSLIGIICVSLNAQSKHSLFAIEGGTSNLRAETNVGGYNIQKSNMGHFGLKLGAESEKYRVFFSARNFIAEPNNKLLTAGVEAQYKLNFSKSVNFFIGVNGGSAYIEVGPDGVNPGLDVTTPYFGGDFGLNYHASELIDVELGAKYMLIDSTITQGTTIYDFRDLTSFYGSIIFKWRVD
nr:hypothetical protein [Sulfurimonas sp. SAG-AH-194-C20]